MALKLLKAGKHGCIGHLSSPVAADSPGTLHYERPAMLVYTGDFDSMDGPVDVTEEDLDRIIESHNKRHDETLARFQGDEEAFVRSMPPLQLDHSTDAHRTIGRVLGRMSKGQYQLTDGRTVLAMFNDRIRVLGAENIEKAKDGRYGPISVGADFKVGVLTELSAVAFPAADGASLLARLRLSQKQGDPAMNEKLKKHLMEAKKMSAEEADAHMGKLKEHLKKHLGFDDEGAAKHLEAMDDEGTEKMGAAMSAGEKLADDVKEEEKKLAAKKLEIVKLAKGTSKDLNVTRLALRSASITSRLSRLQSSAKITPAERKKIDVKALAAGSDAVLEAALASYENREPVIDARVHGTTKAVDLVKLQKAAGHARLAAETKQDLGMPLDEKEKLALVPQPSAPAVDQPPGDHVEHMKHLAALVGDHPQKDAILAHVEKMCHLGGAPVQEVTEQDHKQMSGLVENQNRLHTQIEGLIKLVGEVTGLSAAELTE